MTDRELRRLSKTELLWIIRDQEAEIEELKSQLGMVEEGSNEEKTELEITDEGSNEEKTEDDSDDES